MQWMISTNDDADISPELSSTNILDLLQVGLYAFTMHAKWPGRLDSCARVCTVFQVIASPTTSVQICEPTADKCFEYRWCIFSTHTFSSYSYFSIHSSLIWSYTFTVSVDIILLWLFSWIHECFHSAYLCAFVLLCTEVHFNHAPLIYLFC